MAVELNRLYNEIASKYNVTLRTSSCFGKNISWLHILDNVEFAPFLHGGELIFNSSLNGASEEERKDYIDHLLAYNAGGLIVSLQEEHAFSNTLIHYCNEKKLPLLTTGWDTPFINITRIFSEILIDKERVDMDLIAAFKNAIHYPNDTELYCSHFEVNQFYAKGDYIVSLIDYNGTDSSYYAESIKRIENALHSSFPKCILLKESHSLVLLTCNTAKETLKSTFCKLAAKYQNFLFAIGSEESFLRDIYRSYTNAKHTRILCDKIIPENPLCYEDIGLYKILADMKNPSLICPAFVNQTLGKLIDYDKKNHTKYMVLLKDFFMNDCSITQTANVTYYHQNTLKYKIKNIKDILGYDIMSNQHRLNIMISLAILNALDKKG